jgi:hypothetical protein
MTVGAEAPRSGLSQDSRAGHPALLLWYERLTQDLLAERISLITGGGP